MKRFARPLQAGNTVELHYNYAVNDEATDFPQGTDFIIAIYNINRRCLFDASLSNGGIVKGENTGEYVLTMGFEDTVNMPDRTIMEMVTKDQDGIVKHIDEDIMLLWNNNTINDLVR